MKALVVAQGAVVAGVMGMMSTTRVAPAVTRIRWTLGMAVVVAPVGVAGTVRRKADAVPVLAKAMPLRRHRGGGQDHSELP